MSEFENVGATGDFDQGVGKAVVVGGRMVAVFHVGDEWFAIDDLCPHMGAPLSEGYVEGKCVTCPWHAWHFSFESGQLDGDSKIAVDTYQIKVENDQVWVKLDDEPAP